MGKICLAVVCLLLAGCGGRAADQPDLGTVSGVVTLDGQPLANADLIFQPAAGRPSTGQTDESGRYSLTYSAKAAGAKVGDHQVRITTYRPNRDPKDPGSPEAPERLPARYHSKTELTAQVKPGQNDKPFDLTSK